MVYKIYKFILSKLKLITIDYNEKKFIKHNKILFDYPQNQNSQILIEEHNMQPNYMAISHFSKVLNKIHGAQLVGYQTQIHFNIFNKLKNYIYRHKIKKIYESFGVTKFLDLKTTKYKTSANQLTNKLILDIKSKSDLINLVVDDIWFGDLIYDTYIARYKTPTVNLKSKKFRKILYEFCILYYYWKDLFSKRNIKALVISHACYFIGLPARIGISLGIPVYQVTLQTIYFLSKDNIFPFSEFHSYKYDFEKLNINTKLHGIIKAREKLKWIFDGNINDDQPYLKASAYQQKKTHARILGNKSPIKILIASHSFYDAPNGHGKNLFPDFYEWVKFLGELSNKTNYEWYIKTHPGSRILDKKVITDLVSSYKKIILIPDTTPHHQLIEEGINIVLTVLGSIGLEYAAKNITVINASLNNPHISYNFNIHPKSKEELKDLIFNLSKHVNADLFSDDIYKCYFMKYLFYDHNIFFSNFKSVERQIGGYEFLFSSKIFDYWINYYTPNIQNKIELNLKKFILSGEYKLISPSWN